MAKNTPYDSTSDTTGSTTGSRFSDLGASASGQIDNAPLIALGAGLALGAVLGAVLPASDRERELLGPYGRKLNDAGTGALDRGRGLAKQKFDEMAGDKVREFLGSGSSSTSA
ncbi:hypothetical protein GGQ97_001822 [Sphingomonas kaistensis]|uniref:YtxH domain-containing protein n=1 Tax=Sphingomonas kaistensis TaxID=298708 RepID=A0A7X5Y6D7_9SPHN|nr:hypothetical protein [Sphingomonas kaistensis]NJC06029.1 hypothetical protein [Sphingomonas kaistensis]